MLYFIIGVSIPLLFCIIFWKELRSRRERVIEWFRSLGKGKD